MFGVLKAIRELVSVLAAVGTALEEATATLQAVGPGVEADRRLRERVDELERSRASWEGEVEGMMTKAGARHQAARAAEERARHMTRRLSERSEEGDEEGEQLDALEAYVAEMARRNGPGGGGEELQPVRPGVADRSTVKAALRAAKFGG